MLTNWEKMPKWMREPQVKAYYDLLKKKKVSLYIKRIFDVLAAGILFILLCPAMAVISVCIFVDSPGGVLYRQERVTKNGKRFRIHKFRTMVADADKIGAHVTVEKDSRITRIGSFLRKYRLDELPQLIDVLEGNMTFVGTRPEAVRYVAKYTPEMKATLLLPAGITSEASIRFKDEARLLEGVADVDAVYLSEILPGKMEYNLKSLREFSLLRDCLTLVRTVLAVLGKDEA